MPIPPSSEQSVPSNIVDNDNLRETGNNNNNSSNNVSKKGRKRKTQAQQIDPIKEKLQVVQRVQKSKTTQELVKAYNISLDDHFPSGSSNLNYNYQNQNDLNLSGDQNNSISRSSNRRYSSYIHQQQQQLQQQQQQQQQFQQQQQQLFNKKKHKRKSDILSVNVNVSKDNSNRSQYEGVSSSIHNHLIKNSFTNIINDNNNEKLNNSNNNNNNNIASLTSVCDDVNRYNSSSSNSVDHYNQVNDNEADDEFRTKNELMQRFLLSSTSATNTNRDSELNRNETRLTSNRNIIDDEDVDDDHLVDENGHYLFENAPVNSSNNYNYNNELIDSNSKGNLNRYKDRNRYNVNDSLDKHVDNFVVINKVDLEIRNILSKLPPLRTDEICWSDYEDNEGDDEEEDADGNVPEDDQHSVSNNNSQDAHELEDTSLCDQNDLTSSKVLKSSNYNYYLNDEQEEFNDYPVDEELNSYKEGNDLLDVSPTTSTSPVPNSSRKQLAISRSVTSPSTTAASTATTTTLTTATNKSKTRRKLLPVTKETLDKLSDERIEYVNGTYDSDGQWIEWQEMSHAYNPVSGELLHILPYVNISW